MLLIEVHFLAYPYSIFFKFLSYYQSVALQQSLPRSPGGNHQHWAPTLCKTYFLPHIPVRLLSVGWVIQFPNSTLPLLGLDHSWSVLVFWGAETKMGLGMQKMYWEKSLWRVRERQKWWVEVFRLDTNLTPARRVQEGMIWEELRLKYSS